MNVLVVGGAGYVGGAVTDLLLKDSKNNFRVYDALLFEDCFLKCVDFIKEDVRNEVKLKKQLDWADAVIWLAAIVGDGACQVNPGITYDVNKKAVEFLSKNFDGKIIYMSTCSVYGAADELLNEESKTNPLSIYAKSKLESEQFLKDKNAIIFRLGTLCGKSDNFSRPRMDLVLNVMSQRAIDNKKIKVFGGEQWRPLLNVKDVAHVIIENLDNEKTGVFNLVKENLRMIDLAKRIKNSIEEEIVIEIEDLPFEDLRNYKVSCDKAVKELGFNPRYSIEDSIREIAKLFKEGRISPFGNDRFSNHMFLKNNSDFIKY